MRHFFLASSWPLMPLIALGLAILCFLVFGQILGFDFVGSDDALYVTANPHVQAGLTWNGIAWAFTTNRALYFHPLTWISHMTDCQLFGMHPWGHHLTNLLLHTANAILLFLVLARMTGAVWPSVFVAALFAVHPLHVESVAWTAQRKDLLYTLFWLLGLFAYTAYVRHPGWRRYGWVAVCFTCALMAKPMAVTFPCVLLLLDYWPLRRSWDGRKRGCETFLSRLLASSLPRLLVEKLPLFALSAGVSLLTLTMQASGKGLGKGLVPLESLSFTARVTNALVTYAEYLMQTIWPHDLAVYYPHPFTARPWGQVALASLVLLAITLAALASRKRPYLIVGWLWYLGTLVPVIELVQAGGFARADRYTYLPLTGLFIMVAWTASALITSGRISKLLALGTAMVLLIALSIAATFQVRYWHNGETLFQHALCVTSNNVFAHDNLGAFYCARGDFERAMAEYRASLEANPNGAEALNSLGHIFAGAGRWQEAIPLFERALRSHPENPDALNNVGAALIQTGAPEKAIPYLTKALELNPGNPDVHANLGLALALLGRINEAIEHLQQALTANPNHRQAHETLKWAESAF